MDLKISNKAQCLCGELIGSTLLVTAYSLGIQKFGMGTAMIYLLLIVLLQPISGAHLNPCVTLAQAIANKCSEYRFLAMVIVAQFVGGLCAMTMSMLFRGVGSTVVQPQFVDPTPLIAQAGLSVPKESSVIFLASAFFTAIFVIATVTARVHKEQSPFLIALPSAISLYFANLLTYVSAGGYNNPVVSLILCIQNRKYFHYQTIAIEMSYEWAFFCGPIFGAVIAGFCCMWLQQVYAKV